MEDQQLPIVPFGKYKDKCVLELLADKNYVEWLKQQTWFSNQKQIYNIVVHQTIPIINNSKTPEHNKLQNLFLEKNNQEKLLSTIFKVKINKLKNLFLDENIVRCFGENIMPKFINNLDKTTINFEEKFNWDFVLYYTDNLTITSKIETEISDKIEYKKKYDIQKKEEDNFNKQYEEYRLQYYTDIINKYCNKLFWVEKIHENQYEITIDVFDDKYGVFCELKPLLSDDYPVVLRKLKTQIELTKNDNTKFHRCCGKIFILIIGTFTSSSCSKEQLITIFKQSNIKIIFTNEIFETSKSVAINYDVNTTTNTNHILFEKNLIEENKNLTDTLLQAEKKIKQLEEEIISLKKLNNVN